MNWMPVLGGMGLAEIAANLQRHPYREMPDETAMSIIFRLATPSDRSKPDVE